MAIQKSRFLSSIRSNSEVAKAKQARGEAARMRARQRVRQMVAEQLEQRQLLAVGPQLIGIQPNASDLLSAGDVRTVAPKELVFRFDDVQQIDPATLSGIRLTAAGGDGSFGLATAESDFGSNGRVSIELSSSLVGQNFTVNVQHAVLAQGAPPTISLSGNTVNITLNTRATSRTNAHQLVAAINSSPFLTNRLTAKIKGGNPLATLGNASPSAYSPIFVNQTRDQIIQPGAILVGENPNENEVTMRFSETLKDDLYRIEIFGFDDPGIGVVGLRNVPDAVNPQGSLFRPSQLGTRKDTIDFRLDLGPQVTAVVPQPVVRNSSNGLGQQRDTIVVYFDSDKMLVEYNSDGSPTARSVENPDFYQLIYTKDTVRNTDDVYYKPISVQYNALTNSATLVFATDLNELPGANSPGATYRLRIGTRETRPIAPTEQTAVNVGGTFDTAYDLSILGSASTAQTSLIISSSIDPVEFSLDLPGSSDDAGHRQAVQGTQNSLADHINSSFGADSTAGVTTIYYNFRTSFNPPYLSAITEPQKQRAREVLTLWSNYLGVQFIETADQGLTIATGDMNMIQGGGQIFNAPVGYRVRIDPSFANSAIVLSTSQSWNDQYGESFSRAMAAAVANILGLTRADDVSESELMKFDPAFFFSNNSLIDPNDVQLTANDQRFEPVFPGNQDILHGQFIHRPDSSDVDLYRFEVDFGDEDRVGLFVAETYAQRRADSSELDTTIQLYREVNASAVSNFNVEGMQVEFVSKRPGAAGNQFQVFFTQSDLGSGVLPIVQVFPNAISIALNSTPGSETTVQQMLNAIQASSAANNLVQVRLVEGNGSTQIGANSLSQNPIRLINGRFDLISQNDDYFSRDSYIEQRLGTGVYYIGVSASGNDEYNASIEGSGFGGRTQGDYELRVNFRAEVSSSNTLQDQSGQFIGDRSIGLDGDADGHEGGTYDFWFQTRPLDRTLKFLVGANGSLEGRTVTVVGANGTTRVFEFTTDTAYTPGRYPIQYNSNATANVLAVALANAINARSELGVTVTATGTSVKLRNERLITLDPVLENMIDVGGKTIFVDKSAGTNANGSLAHPFNSISGSGVPNAFAATHPGDIVRIVGNGGTDGNLSTINNNLAYEIGRGLLPVGSALSDGLSMDIPQGVIAMIDAGAVFKLRGAAIQAGSSNLSIDRSGAVLQVLGSPYLVDAAGNALRNASTGDLVSGHVYFTSWLDESIGMDGYAPTTNPARGDWGGLILRRDMDQASGRKDLEDEGIFLRTVTYADIRYGGGTVNIDSIQQVVNPIHIISNRPTIHNNRVQLSASAAISIDPNALEETNFNEPRYQLNGAFTSDYERIGPTFRGNRLVSNSINGVFVGIETPATGSIRTLTVPGRMDDTDVTYVLSESLIVSGSVGGSILDATKPPAEFVMLLPNAGGELSPGTYNYKLTYVDRNGYESVASDATSNIVLQANQTAINVTGLNGATGDFVTRRLYRSAPGGNGPYTLVGVLDRTSPTFLDIGQNLGGTLAASSATAVKRPRLAASLVVDPAMVLKLESARIEAQMGATIIAEGVDGLPIFFTSLHDDTVGAGGTFRTSDSSASTPARPRDWGGIYMAPTSNLSIDYARISYGGGVTRIDGTFRGFNVIEVHQADARIAHTEFNNNADGMGGQGPGSRLGRLSNSPATIFVRGAQPIIIDNTFRGNAGSVIRIDINSMTDELIGDAGRQTGAADRNIDYIANRGPLIRENRMDNNDLNALEIRGGILTTGSVWDDTDIVHAVFQPIFTGNIQHVGGLRLQSSPSESLVVKFDGYGSNFQHYLGAGLTAYGDRSTANDRVGGTLHIIGQPNFPVILTSLKDDTVGAGLQPNGFAMTDTNNDGIGSIPQPADWRGILIDQYANDRNVAIVLELEDHRAAAPGPNATPLTAQLLGELASSAAASNESLQLGFVVEGVLSQPEDVDVYSFAGTAGTEVWFDVDYTKHNLDMELELLDANGNLLARSSSSTFETADPSLLVTSGALLPASVNPLNVNQGDYRLSSSGAAKETGTTNVNDPGMRVRLPGASGSRSTYYVRLRSRGHDVDQVGSGMSAGAYQVQVRLREAQEWAGSTVRFADIRYAMNGIHLIGQPGESPLMGEVGEDENAGAVTIPNGVNVQATTGQSIANNSVATGLGQYVRENQDDLTAEPFLYFQGETGNRPQHIGNILDTAKGAISVAGSITANDKVDFYRLEVRSEDVGLNGYAPVVFDIDYADGLNRPDLMLNIFREEASDLELNLDPAFGPYETAQNQYRLIYTSSGSNVADDQARPLSGADMSDLSRGSAGTNDPFLGPLALPEGIYLVAISSVAYQPRALEAVTGTLPLNSVRRIVDENYIPGVTTAEPPEVIDFLPETTIGADGELVSNQFNLGRYSAADLPKLYLSYTRLSAGMTIAVRRADGTETTIATAGDLPTGTNRNYQRSLAGFAGEDGLRLVFRSTNPDATINNVIIGFAERGEQITSMTDEDHLTSPNAPLVLVNNQTVSTPVFSLATYDDDGPQVSFEYDIDTDGPHEVRMFVVEANGQRTRIATTQYADAEEFFNAQRYSINPPFGFGLPEFPLQTDGVEPPFGDPRHFGLIDLSPWAGQSGLRIEIVASREGDPPYDPPSTSFFRNFHIVLNDGSRILSGEPNSTYVRVNAPPSAVTTGNYQLEVRLGDTYFQSGGPGGITLTKSFDTNDRLAEGVNITAPGGADLTDQDKFSLSDGIRTVVFEFTTDGTVGVGNVPIQFASADPNYVIARRIRDAINSSLVQQQLQIKASTSSGIASGTSGRDPRLALSGTAQVRTIQAIKPTGQVQVEYSEGRSDSNVKREQGQIVIQNNFIRQSRDYGVWSEPAPRMLDPRDTVQGEFGQNVPGRIGTQAVRNLLAPNNSVQGGLVPGVVIQNNVLEEGGLGGVYIAGESPIWMISPNNIPATDLDPTDNAQGAHFGDQIDDSDVLIIDSDRTRLRFEFEDLAGGAAGGPTFGSGEVEGNGVQASSSVAWYRDTGGDFYQRLQGGELQAFATTALETMHALRDSILGSILVTNGTTQTITATVSKSMAGVVPLVAQGGFGASYPNFNNRPALYLQGVTSVQYENNNGPAPGNPFIIRTLALGQSPQPYARIINNTIIGQDGRATFNGESPLVEDNDTIADAVQTWQGTAAKPLSYSQSGIIGDGGPPIASGATNGSSGGGSSGSGGGGSNGNGNSNASYSSSQVIIRFNDDLSIAQQNQFITDRGLELVKRYDFINSALVRIRDNRTVVAVVSQLNTFTQHVAYAEPNYLYTYDVRPNDPRYTEQWALHNTGQTGGTAGADIGAEEAWEIFSGSPEVVVAIMDSGVDYTHPDLRPNMWVNPGEVPGNGVDDDGNGYIDDVYGWNFADGTNDPMDAAVSHGTHVAGIVGARGNNALGVAGASWNSKIMAMKIGGDAGPSTAAAIEALDYMSMMRNQYGVNIVAANASWGSYSYSQALYDAIAASNEAGVLFVAASGNDSINNDLSPAYPASFDLDGVISVAATDHNDRLANFSNYGATTVDIAAPGVNILSTFLGGGYQLSSGTSMAAPYVTGVAALLAGYQPGISVAGLKQGLLTRADYVDNLNGFMLTSSRLSALGALSVPPIALQSSTDVDIFQFKLGTGERAFVNVASLGSGLHAALRIFDSTGVAQPFVNFQGDTVLVSGNEGPEGTWLRDPTADFTALKPGVYYAAVSSTGNINYDPLSLAGRTRGDTTGAYRISIDARTLQEFVITAQDASEYTTGETFTIHGVPDSDISGTTGVTFEFVLGGGGPTNPAHIPINLDPTWRFPDVARAIAKAINEGNAGGPAVSNAQQLPNGSKGTASPLPAAHAQALGGLTGVLDAPLNTVVGPIDNILQSFGTVDRFGWDVLSRLSKRETERLLTGPVGQINLGLPLFPESGGRTNADYGIGHNRDSTVRLSSTSVGDGTTEKFVVVRNVAYIDGNGAVLVSPDVDTNNNLNQLIPETGVMITRGASPTLLNNVFFNVQTPVVNEESRRYPITGMVAPYGTNNPNAPVKPGQVVLGGSVYQYFETDTSITRFATGIEASPTNVPNTALDFNQIVPETTQLFVNAQAGNYLPAPHSPLIDSAIDSLQERAGMATVKSAMGLALSPVLAPTFDVAGQLRTDDPDVAPPQGQGFSVFKDRGAFDRADFVGPAALLLRPVDNDALGVDHDPSDSVVKLVDGVYPEFRILLKDGNEPANPLFGLGINDSSVTGEVIPGLRALGAAVVLTENGRLLTEGVDYRFSYNSTRDEIVLTPLAGVWKNGSVYEITINNRDRFVIDTPAGHQVADGDIFRFIDENGALVQFEFDSGYRLQVPRSLTMLVPETGAGFGGIADGERFIISTGTGSTTFEFDTNSNVLSGNRAVPILAGSSQQAVVNAIIAAINGAQLGLVAIDLGAGEVAIGAESGVRLNTSSTLVAQPVETLAFFVPDNIAQGIVRDAHRFSLSDGRRTATFEFDNNGAVSENSIAIDFTEALTSSDVIALIREAIVASRLNLSPTVLSNNLLYLGLPADGSVEASNSPLGVLGTSRTVGDGQTISIRNGNQVRTFEFSRDNSVADGNIRIPVEATTSQDEIADRIVAAISSSGLGLQPSRIGHGNILIGGTESTSINMSNVPSLELFGSPGIQSSTRLGLLGPLLVTVPPLGAASIIDNSTFSLTGDNGRTVIFEFDGNFSGPSQPGNVVVTYLPTSSAADIARAIATAVASANVGITPVELPGGVLNFGRILDSSFDARTSGLTTSRGLIEDGEHFTITYGNMAVTFEFDNTSLDNGFTLGRTPIFFSPSSTNQAILAAMQAAINSAGLNLTSTIQDNELRLNDSSLHSIDTSLAPTVSLAGVPGGTHRVAFVPDANFTAEDMKRAIIAAINSAAGTTLQAFDRGGSTLWVSGAISISDDLDSYFVKGVSDLAGNLLKPNRIDDETRFTILMPGVKLNFGDAPDPFGGTQGRYPTRFANDGARHVVTGDPSTSAILGSTISISTDGHPSANAAADLNDDGVVFGANYQTPGLFNKGIQTSITVTLSSPGYLDGWIDWNVDGDWSDPFEQVFDSIPFTAGNLTQTFWVTVPASAPIPTSITATYARFRSSTRGSLAPTGLSVDGEVEDYQVVIAPGTPPTAVDDTYTVPEEGLLVTTDVQGQTTPNFRADDGIAANDTNPDNKTLGVELVQGPAHAKYFELLSDGTFTYDPADHYWGIDTFTYRVNDGTLNSNNIGTVTITVTDINDAPVVVNDTLETDENVPLTFNASALLANDSPGPNEAHQTITVTRVDTTTSGGGTVSLVAGVITYTPGPSFSGTDTFTYTVTDNGTTNGVSAPLSSTGTVTITVREVNDPPVAGAYSTSVTENTPAAASKLELNAQVLVDLAVEGPVDERSWQAIRFIGVTVASAQGGSVAWNSTTNVITYIPAVHFAGTDYFYYEIEDYSTDPNQPIESRRATGTVTVTVTNVNDAPFVITPLGAVSMAEDETPRTIDLSNYFSDHDIATVGDSLTYRIISNSQSSLVNPTVNGSQLTLALLADQNGQSLIVVEAEDQGGLTVRGTLTLTVSAVNDAPRLAAPLPNVTVNKNSVIPGIQLSPAYFLDPDVVTNGDALTFSINSNTNPLLVTPAIVGGVLQLTLLPNQFGTAIITISATDSSGLSVSSTLNLTVNNRNEEPVAQPDSYSVAQGTTLNVNAAQGVLANDTDAEGATLTAVLVNGPQFASQFSLNANGSFTYRHNGVNRTTDTFTYRAFDGEGNSNVVSVTITINPPPPSTHQNLDRNTDVNADGRVSAIDALLVINLLNTRSGAIRVEDLPPPPPFVDVNGDYRVSALDALIVINELNLRSSGGGANGEGEAYDSSSTGGVSTSELLASYWSAAPSVVVHSDFNQAFCMYDVPVEELGEVASNAVFASRPGDSQEDAAAIFAERGANDSTPFDLNWVEELSASNRDKLSRDDALAELMSVWRKS